MLVLALALSTVRAEPVEASSFLAAVGQKKSPSTSSGRTDKGSVIEAERAFAADARNMGQWAAFRRWAAPDAIMFVPEPTNAQAWLKDRSEPAQAIQWWPTTAWISCDGTLAADTGGWRRPDGSVGYFTTIWDRKADGAWQWIVDAGDALATLRPDPGQPSIRTASCSTAALSIAAAPMTLATAAAGLSHDGTLVWQWSYMRGVRRLNVQFWNGKDYEVVLSDQASPAPKP